MSRPVPTPYQAIRRRRPLPVWVLAASAALVLGIGLMVWRFGLRFDPGFIEYPMLRPTDIPTAVAVAPDGAVWFTIEFSNAIGLWCSGTIERLSEGTQNLEPMGLAVAADGSACYTDSPARAISRIARAGEITSFPLSTPIAKLGRLAVAPDGSVWFAESTAYSITRRKDGEFTRYVIESVSSGPSSRWTPTARCGPPYRMPTSWCRSRPKAR